MYIAPFELTSVVVINEAIPTSFSIVTWLKTKPVGVGLSVCGYKFYVDVIAGNSMRALL